MNNIIQSYVCFLSSLQSMHCDIKHYVTYRKNKIKGMAFNDVVAMPNNVPPSMHFHKVLIENDNNKYITYKNNAHHWTTNYCWTTFLPLLMSQLNVQFDQSKFQKIPFIWSICDFSYHNLPSAKFKVKMFGTNMVDIGDNEVLRNINNCPFMALSCYHALFKLSHCSGTVLNFNDAPLQRVAVNCDSMSIPVLPVLANFCKSMLVVDNRSGKNLNYMKMILDFKPTHYIALFTEENFLFNQKHIKQIL